jgi:hypothetical protein
MPIELYPLHSRLNRWWLLALKKTRYDNAARREAAGESQLVTPLYSLPIYRTHANSVFRLLTKGNRH